MPPRRPGPPASAPSSVIVEFHEFAGRWFVTDRWGAGSGAAIPARVRKAALGKVVLGFVTSARSHWRSLRTAADDAELWARFCAEVAGVQLSDYQPEKRLVILAGKTGIQCCDASQSPPSWEALPARSPRALGKALIKRIRTLEPSAPAGGLPARSALRPGAGAAGGIVRWQARGGNRADGPFRPRWFSVVTTGSGVSEGDCARGVQRLVSAAG